MSLTANTTIAAGSTVVIAAGATINVSNGASIIVSGTLAASSQCGAHAKLVWASGAGASVGIVVAGGGKVLLDGVDITGAGTPLLVQGNATAQYDNGTITGAMTPFNESALGTLTTTGATVTGTRGTSIISGTFTAKSLNYDSGGNAGLSMDQGANVDIENSKFHGTGPSADMLISGENGGVGATIKVVNTEISLTHCAFHFQPVKSFNISYTNMHDNAYGFMLFGSTAASTMTNSNVDSTNSTSFSATSNAAISFDHNYIPSPTTTAGTGVTITNASTTPIAGTGPM